MSITIVGLGPGNPDHLTLEAWKVLERASTVILRTARHPAVQALPEGPVYRSLDDRYEQAEDFAALYESIAGEITTLGAGEDIVYAVPGHPFVAEETVTRIMALAAEQAIPIRVVDGLSFIEPALTALGIDAADGLQVHDALSVAAMHHPPLNPDSPALLAQVYSRAAASDLKLTLMNQYPDDHPVKLLHGLGTDEAWIEAVPLYAIDRSEHIAHLTALYIPPLPHRMSSFERLQETMAHLRSPEGCPWDREQTHQSLRPYLLEEAYEVLDALDSGDVQALSEELGDLLLQVVFHCQVAVDEGEFRMTDVIHHINNKLIHRHPHVWGEVNVRGADDVTRNWEAIKKQERRANGQGQQSLLDGIARTLPALAQAYNYQVRAARVGFDWDRIEPVIEKIGEEIAEIQAADSADTRAAEIGDLLFAVVNWVRWLGVDPETTLREANRRFYRRFHYLEQAADAAGRPLADMSLAEMDALWEEAKSKGL